ncbi:glycerate kinase [Geomonas sp. Red32]|uniref:glycerate kinase type-2 family protein n=1 Tax=Geomonas sp. Red32 TaxID=2912856 RepID=UPI00202D006B|nr:glycerate kinase [Geomonas sp. Red32]MCM0080923.1 glycerate kinase [Geomonas sp. Red32]
MTDRELIDNLFCAALAAVDPLTALPSHLREVAELYLSGPFDRLLVAGFGKAGVPMALAAEECLGEMIGSGLVIVPHSSNLSPQPHRIELATGGHPHPNAEGVAATSRLMEMVRGADDRTLLLVLISGGGSALCSAPAEGITLEEKQAACRLLMEAGADIRELNTVRKHLSRVKGGQLAALAMPARTVALTISDVPGDLPEIIASGPVAPDPSTFGDALAVFERLGIADRVPKAVLRRLRLGAAGEVPETPKPGSALFDSVTTVIAASNGCARAAAAHAALQRGIRARVLEEPVCGEAKVAGRRLAELALAERKKLSSGERCCIVSGGETTVQVKGNGKGGRNQEVAVAFALGIEGVDGVTFLSAGTDGIDGPTDAAGAIVDGSTAAKAKGAGFDPLASLEENDTYRLLESCGALLKTGPTGTNVMDLQIVLLRG